MGIVVNVPRDERFGRLGQGLGNLLGVLVQKQMQANETDKYSLAGADAMQKVMQLGKKVTPEEIATVKPSPALSRATTNISTLQTQDFDAQQGPDVQGGVAASPVAPDAMARANNTLQEAMQTHFVDAQQNIQQQRLDAVRKSLANPDFQKAPMRKEIFDAAKTAIPGLVPVQPSGKIRRISYKSADGGENVFLQDANISLAETKQIIRDRAPEYANYSDQAMDDIFSIENLGSKAKYGSNVYKNAGKMAYEKEALRLGISAKNAPTGNDVFLGIQTLDGASRVGKSLAQGAAVRQVLEPEEEVIPGTNPPKASFIRDLRQKRTQFNTLLRQGTEASFSAANLIQRDMAEMQRQTTNLFNSETGRAAVMLYGENAVDRWMAGDAKLFEDAEVARQDIEHQRFMAKPLDEAFINSWNSRNPSFRLVPGNSMNTVTARYQRILKHNQQVAADPSFGKEQELPNLYGLNAKLTAAEKAKARETGTLIEQMDRIQNLFDNGHMDFILDKTYPIAWGRMLIGRYIPGGATKEQLEAITLLAAVRNAFVFGRGGSALTDQEISFNEDQLPTPGTTTQAFSVALAATDKIIRDTLIGKEQLLQGKQRGEFSTQEARIIEGTVSPTFQNAPEEVENEIYKNPASLTREQMANTPDSVLDFYKTDKNWNAAFNKRYEQIQ